MASTEVASIARLAFLSRVLVIVIQFIANLLLPDHDAEAFKPPWTEEDRFSVIDKVIIFILGGFHRWDATYYVHIAQHGYTFENCAAFFPLYPLLISRVKWISALCPFLSELSLLLLFGVVLNVVLFVSTAVLLLHLGQAVTKDADLAYNAAVLFCINPASIFMTALYTETLFAFLSFGGMLYIVQHKMLAGSILIGLSALTRSNGLVSTGFVFHCLAVRYIRCIRTSYMLFGSSMTKFVCSVISETSITALRAASFLLMVLIPFSCFQFYIYKHFCFVDGVAGLNSNVDKSVLEYGQKELLRLAGEGPISPWCFDSPPLSYSYIQSHYWEVGFLAYFQVKQIPNFILAMPIITVSLCACYSFYCRQPSACKLLGLTETDKAKVETIGSSSAEEQSGWNSPRLVVYVFHLLFLTLFGCLFMHIQVLTRFLCSSSPLIYWFTAHIVWKQSVDSSGVDMPLDGSEIHNVSDFLALYRTCTSHGKYVLAFFLAYFVTGTVAFSNFLPWT